LEYLPALQDDPARRCPDISRVSGILGWRPTVPLEQGLRDTVAWFRAMVK
jgi:dTDP-glucose 4,6-dehydratase